MRRLAISSLLLGLAALVPVSRSEAQMPSTEFAGWTSVGAGFAMSGEFLWHGSAWFAPEKVAVGLRQSGRGLLSSDMLMETSILVGMRPGFEHSTVVLVAGLALENRLQRDQQTCFGCPREDFFTGRVAPTVVFEGTGDTDRMGLGFSATGVGGRNAFVGVSLILRVAFLQRIP